MRCYETIDWGPLEDGECSAQMNFVFHPSAKLQPASAILEAHDLTNYGCCHGDGERPIFSLKRHFLPSLEAVLLLSKMVVIMF